jgi:hypothetical protein
MPSAERYTLLVFGGLVLAVAGFMVGRAHPAHPAHHYQKWFSDGALVFDVSTGILCDPRGEAKGKACSRTLAVTS